MTRERFPPHRVWVEQKHDRRGFPPLVVSLCEGNTTGEGLPLPSSCLCGKETRQERVSPSRRVCVEQKHDGREFSPPRRICGITCKLGVRNRKEI